jgi:hypothetical protein
VARPNSIQRVFDTLGRDLGFVKRSGAWYRRRRDLIEVLELQKSQFAPMYFVNLAIWLLPLGDEQYPKERLCHIRTRLSKLVTDEKRLARLLDLDFAIDDDSRAKELRAILESTLVPLAALETISDLRSGDGARLVEASLVRGEAHVLLR